MGEDYFTDARGEPSYEKRLNPPNVLYYNATNKNKCFGKNINPDYKNLELI